MKRRDLLRGMGALALATPAAGATSLLKANGELFQPAIKKDMVVAFSGPFCFWSDEYNGKVIKVYAPPVGPDFCKAPHQPWVGTTSNEKVIEIGLGQIPQGTNLTLDISGYSSPTEMPRPTGTTPFEYRQVPQDGVTPLFSLTVPIPDAIIGVRPTYTNIECTQSTAPYCNRCTILASGLSFVYKQVGLEGVRIKNGSSEFFKPCFVNDAPLQDATLGVHLSPLIRTPDPEHTHATTLWFQMMGMFPSMYDDIKGIEFCDFDHSLCIPRLPSNAVVSPHKKGGAPVHALVGPGDDCQVPIMTFPSTGSTKK